MPDVSRDSRDATATEILHELALRPTPENPSGPLRAAVASIASIVATNRIAAHLDNTELGEQLHGAANAALEELLDDFCGTPPHPRHFGLAIATELAAMAETMSDGPARTDFLGAARTAATKSFTFSPQGSDPMPALDRNIALRR